jgi:protein-tyrosine phosphatase
MTLPTIPAKAENLKKIAFVDTGNTGRSLTAEMLARGMIREKKLPIAVISRAVDMNPFIVEPEANFAKILLRRSVDVSAYRAVQLSANDVRHADLIITMTGQHKAKVIELFPDAKPKTFTISDYASGRSEDIADAIGTPMAFYEHVFKQIDALIPSVIEKSLAT